jgi:hypothetical protein
MFEKFTRGDARDFATRYQGTFGFFERPNRERRLVKLTFIDDTVRFIDEKEIEYHIDADNDEDAGFEFLPPRTGFSNSIEGALYSERVAQRQFTRGICDRNTRMYRLDGKAFEQVSIGFKYLNMAYDKKKMDASTAFRRYAAQLLPSFSISPQFGFDKQKVYVFTTVCGFVRNVTSDSITIKLEHPDLFRTEIRDNFRGVANVEFVDK